MNFLGILLGAAAVKQLTDYPAEIRELRSQVPRSDRDTVMGGYKKLPNKAKTEFKEALKRADIEVASQILGQDLTKYKIQLKKKDEAASTETKTLSPEMQDFAARIDKILAVPTSIDPELVAEAARRYEEAVPANSRLGITERTQKLINMTS